MQLFFSNDIRDEHAWFSEEEARHCLQALRKKEGDTIHFVNGTGGMFAGQIEESGKKNLVVKITETLRSDAPPAARLHLAVAPVKNMERFEWFLEKATEIGVGEITPLHCEHSERTKIRLDRMEKIVLSAMKQCLITWLPKLNELTDFERFMKKMEAPGDDLRFIPNCHRDNYPSLKNNCLPGRDVTILIGPEGDFSLKEIALAERHGFQSVGLGKNRLRTETAGIVACHIFNLIND